MTGDPMIECKGPTKRFGHFTAVDQARIQVLIDGSNSSIASSSLNTSLNVGFRKAMLELAARAGVRDLPVEVRPQILYNPEMQSPNFFVPGVIGLVLQIATMFTTAMSLVRERERGTLEQLMVSAVLPATYYIELQRTIVLRGASLGDFWVTLSPSPGWVWR